MASLTNLAQDIWFVCSSNQNNISSEHQLYHNHGRDAKNIQRIHSSQPTGWEIWWPATRSTKTMPHSEWLFHTISLSPKHFSQVNAFKRIKVFYVFENCVLWRLNVALWIRDSPAFDCLKPCFATDPRVPPNHKDNKISSFFGFDCFN